MNRPASPKRHSSVCYCSVQLPLCEGWLEKYALRRGIFAAKGWHRRYVFLTNDGIGFCRANPREKGNYPVDLPLRASVAKTLIPFARKRHGEVVLEPVYVVDDVSVARHPAVPQSSHNGICSATVSSTNDGDNSSLNVSAKDGLKSGIGAHSCTYYYFGISFEEHRKRYLLLLRTDSAQEYIKWTTYLPLFLHEGSATRLVPLGHPLEAGRPQPVDVNYRRLTGKRESTLPGSVTFYFDPDPCTADEHVKVRRMCLGWDEGEAEHLFQPAMYRVECVYGRADNTAMENLVEMQLQNEVEYRRKIEHQFDVLGPSVPAYEAQSPPLSANKAHASDESTPQTALPQLSRHVDAVDLMADDVSGATRSKHPTQHVFAPSPNLTVLQRKNPEKQDGIWKNTYNDNGNNNNRSDAYSDRSAHGAAV